MNTCFPIEIYVQNENEGDEQDSDYLHAAFKPEFFAENDETVRIAKYRLVEELEISVAPIVTSIRQL